MSGWFWAGVALALLIFLPNFLWLVRHDFISYHFLQHIHARDVGEGRAEGFLEGPVPCLRQSLRRAALACRTDRYSCATAATACLPGCIWSRLRSSGSAKAAATTSPAPIPCCWPWARSSASAGSLRCPAGAAAPSSRLLRRLRLVRRLHLARWSFPSHPAARCATSRSATTATCAKSSAGTELVHTVAGIRDSLPPDQQAHLGITTGNYGEYGAIDILGRAYGLPAPIGTTNSEWLRGYPTPPPTTIIVLGLSSGAGQPIFTGCRLAGHNGNTEASATKKAPTTPTSSSAARRASRGPRFGKSIRTSADPHINALLRGPADTSWSLGRSLGALFLLRQGGGCD